MFDENVTVLANRKINAEYYKLIFRSERLSRNVKPGQFLHLKLTSGQDPFLRRPFSYYRIAGERVEILYEILGRGTGLLAHVQAGEKMRVMGPLGREFSTPRKKKRILVGGGVGVPPLVFLAERFGCHRFFIGIKTRAEVLPGNELRKLKRQVSYSTNDGSYGTKGFVTKLLEAFLEEEQGKLEDYWIQTCGPQPMMEAVIRMASRYGIQGEASWDERMACGVGVCLGCMVWTRKGWVPSCTEGPVFPFDETPLEGAHRRG